MAIRIVPRTASSLADDLRKANAEVAAGAEPFAETLIPALILAGQSPGRPASGKVVISLRLDPAVIAKFRATGPGWQSRINDVLQAAKL